MAKKRAASAVFSPLKAQKKPSVLSELPSVQVKSASTSEQQPSDRKHRGLVGGAQLQQLLKVLSEAVQSCLAKQTRIGDNVQTKLKKHSSIMAALKAHLFIGINEVTKALERMEPSPSAHLLATRAGSATSLQPGLGTSGLTRAHGTLQLEGAQGMDAPIVPQECIQRKSSSGESMDVVGADQTEKMLAQASRGGERHNQDGSCPGPAVPPATGSVGGASVRTLNQGELQKAEEYQHRNPGSSHPAPSTLAVKEEPPEDSVAAERQTPAMAGQPKLEGAPMPVLLVLQAADVHPRQLAAHLPPLAALKCVPLISITGGDGCGSVRLGASLGLTTAMAVGIKGGDPMWEAVAQLLAARFT